MVSKSYGFCLTINNPILPVEIYPIAKQSSVDGKMEFNDQLFTHAVIGHEHFSGQRYGKKLTPHLQIALCFTKKTSWQEVKLLFPRAHIEPLKYSYECAVLYCMKEGYFVTYGDIEVAKSLTSKLRVAARDVSAPYRSKSNAVEVNGEVGGVSITPPPVLPQPCPSTLHKLSREEFDEWQYQNFLNDQKYDAYERAFAYEVADTRDAVG